MAPNATQIIILNRSMRSMEFSGDNLEAVISTKSDSFSVKEVFF